ALDHKADFAELEKYNKWLLGSTIPSDKDYYVMLPVRGAERVVLASNENTSKLPAASNKQHTSAAAAAIVSRNGLNALVARNGDTKDKLALQAGISTRKFLKYNDMRSFDEIEAGATYYTERKSSSASTEFHVVQPGETMQMISQHYGVQLKHLLFKNRMKRNEVPVPGRVLWLKNRRPLNKPVEVRELNKQTAARQEMTASDVKPAKQATPAAKTAKAADNSPKENVFTRFINSFKKNKKQAAPAKQQPATVEQKPATTVRYGTNASPEEMEQLEKVKQAEEETKEESIAEPKQAQPVTREAIYPGQRTAAPAATTPKPAATPKQEPVKPATTTTKTQPVKEVVQEETTWASPDKPEKKVEIAPTEKPQHANTSPATKSAKHVVAKGETLYGIAKMYNVTVADLTSWNNLGEGPLKLGQELIVAEPLTPAQPAAAEEVEEVQEMKSVGGYHTVVAGETLYQISKKYDITLEELKQWNNMSENSVLSIGQELHVIAPPTGTPTQPEAAPAAKEAPAQTIATDTYHTVVAGESMYQISRKYGVTIKDIMEWNKKDDFNVKPGEKLLIKKKN
ncbi:MAG TPA: LysM peptidoglycan-binding domain-containing protein, partial [Pontibacter sp.]